MPAQQERLLMIFVKNPIPGKVKTRLAKDVGEDQATIYYQKLLQITHSVASKVRADRWVWYGDFINEDDLWNKGAFAKQLQHGEDLGDRMSHAFNTAFNAGYEKVIIIGSDCPEIDPDILENAFEKLSPKDVVVGPANDGGYYLLGMSGNFDLFDSINWSTAEVFPATMGKIREAGLSFEQLPELTDLDTIEDLKKFSHL